MLNELRALRQDVRDSGPAALGAGPPGEVRAALDPLSGVMDRLLDEQSASRDRQSALADEMGLLASTLADQDPVVTDPGAGDPQDPEVAASRDAAMLAMRQRLDALEQELRAKDREHDEIQEALRQALDLTSMQLEVFLQRLQSLPGQPREGAAAGQDPNPDGGAVDTVPDGRGAVDEGTAAPGGAEAGRPTLLSTDVDAPPAGAIEQAVARLRTDTSLQWILVGGSVLLLWGLGRLWSGKSAAAAATDRELDPSLTPEEAAGVASGADAVRASREAPHLEPAAEGDGDPNGGETAPEAGAAHGSALAASVDEQPSADRSSPRGDAKDSDSKDGELSHEERARRAVRMPGGDRADIEVLGEAPAELKADIRKLDELHRETENLPKDEPLPHEVLAASGLAVDLRAKPAHLMGDVEVLGTGEVQRDDPDPRGVGDVDAMDADDIDVFADDGTDMDRWTGGDGSREPADVPWDLFGGPAQQRTADSSHVIPRPVQPRRVDVGPDPSSPAPEPLPIVTEPMESLAEPVRVGEDVGGDDGSDDFSILWDGPSPSDADGSDEGSTGPSGEGDPAQHRVPSDGDGEEFDFDPAPTLTEDPLDRTTSLALDFVLDEDDSDHGEGAGEPTAESVGDAAGGSRPEAAGSGSSSMRPVLVPLDTQGPTPSPDGDTVTSPVVPNVTVARLRVPGVDFLQATLQLRAAVAGEPWIVQTPPPEVRPRDGQLEAQVRFKADTPSRERSRILAQARRALL